MDDPQFNLFTFTHELELLQGFDNPTAICEPSSSLAVVLPYSIPSLIFLIVMR